MTAEVPGPPRTFGELPLGDDLARGLAAAGLVQLREIQAAAIPAALAGRDVLGLAPSGTGKTAAYLVPVLARLAGAERRTAAPRALILVPTRELATQVDEQARRLGRFDELRTTTVYGGVSLGRQEQALAAGTDLITACPGRLLDLLGRGSCDLSAVQVLVLDEADRMFELGFWADLRRILARLPAARQNLLFSASLPEDVRALAEDLLRDPLRCELSNTAPAGTIEHLLYPLPEGRKVELLLRLLAEAGSARTVVFLRTKLRVERLAERLERAGLRSTVLQGGLSQKQRDRALESFRGGQHRLLLATELGARGLDVAGVEWVINFDVPESPESYVHRIGRTGRAERSGRAATLATRAERQALAAIEKRLGAPIPRRFVAGLSDPESLRQERRRVERGAPARDELEPERRLRKPDPGPGDGGGKGRSRGDAKRERHRGPPRSKR